MGDEVRRTQQGNNNAYCQDNEISWFDWSRVDSQSDLMRFVKGLLHFRQNSVLYRDRHYWFEPGGTDIHWHGVRLDQPDFGENSHSLAFELTHPNLQDHLYVALNAYWEPLEFELPPLPAGRAWTRLVDTGLAPPQDFSHPTEALPGEPYTYLAQSRSVVVLTANGSKK
jgi:isoamylase